MKGKTPSNARDKRRRLIRGFVVIYAVALGAVLLNRYGFGHTFPGKPTPDVGGSRPVVLGIPVPMWLVRIDYIFYSEAFVAIDAQLGPDDAGSDHRAVAAIFSLHSAQPAR